MRHPDDPAPTPEPAAPPGSAASAVATASVVAIAAEPAPEVPDELARAAQEAAEAGVRRIRVVAWRDLAHPDAGGSEIHLHEILRRWAAAGLEVTLLTGRVAGRPGRVERAGYSVRRAGGPLAGLVGTPLRARRRPADATVEVWHGVNFCGPLWIRGPRVAIAHHVHRPEFGYVLPRPVAWAARHQEGTLSPRLYRGTPLVTLSAPARDAFADLGFDPASITVVPPGVDARFSPAPQGGRRSATPLVLTVARLWPQKRIDRLIDVMARLRVRHPQAELLVVGDGPCRPALESRAAASGAAVRFAGAVPDARLVELYRSAWVLASASFGEGWGMTITEAAACGTPAVVIVNTGHRQAVVDGETGLLAADEDALVAGLDRVLADAALRERLGAAAADHARSFDWDRAALHVLEVVTADARRRPRARQRADR
jgi:glycosyltransferase involved in cell wall biosynthesis